jgi:putative transposase
VTGTAVGANLRGMLAILQAVVDALIAALRPRASLVAENLVLRQQLAILGRATPRPRLRPIDRAFWIIVSRLWSRWAECLAIVQPATVIGWHRRGFVRWWAWKSRPVGRPPLAPLRVHLGRGERGNTARLATAHRARI